MQQYSLKEDTFYPFIKPKQLLEVEIPISDRMEIQLICVL